MEPESSPWVLASEPDPSATADGTTMLVNGQTFCIGDARGDVDAHLAHGLFVADARVLSQVRLVVDGRRTEPLSTVPDGAHAMVHVGRTPMRDDGGRLLVVRRRELADGLHEVIEIRNHGRQPVQPTVRLELAADFADVFAVKEGRSAPRGTRTVTVSPAGLVVSWTLHDVRRVLTVEVSPAADVAVGGAEWRPEIPPGATATLRWHATIAEHGHERPVPHPDRWLERAPALWSQHRDLEQAFRRSLADLAALRLVDPAGLRRPVVAAGAPWFMTLFGRDSLLTAYMALPADPELATGVLDALAELQGHEVDAAREEEPGRILHEVRFHGSATFDLASGLAYYGSVDATPLFVVLLAEAARWGLPTADLLRLLPHADRALAWVRARLSAHPLGLLAYRRASSGGLEQQGWKDSWDGIRHADGSVVRAPVALCEAQAYAYAAFAGRAELAERIGEPPAEAERWRAEAAALARRFDDLFWIDDADRYATAIDGDGRPATTLTSNLGHCLWAGIVPAERAGAVAAALCGPSMWTGWGVRTLAADEVAYDPLSYHCGSVWPHDTAIVAAGLARYGFGDEAARLARGLLDAASYRDGRLPELFAGLDRSDVPAPVTYPTSCSPQAWAAATPLLLTRLGVGLRPTPGGLVTAAVALPGFEGTVVRGLRWWGGSLDLRIDDAGRIAPIDAGDRRSAVRDRRRQRD